MCTLPKQVVKSLRQQAGLTLVELLIAMLLGLTLALGVMEIYVGTSTTERDQDARLRIQENGRFALNFLSNEIRMAGYLGCQGTVQGASANNTLNGPPASFQPETGIQGWEAGGTAPGDIANSVANAAVVASGGGEWTTGDAGFVIPAVNAVPNSDILRLWGNDGAAFLVEAIDNAGATFDASVSANIQVNDFIILSDCEQFDIVQACAVGAPADNMVTVSLAGGGCAPGNVGGARITSLASATEPAEGIRLQGAMYYVGKRGDTATNPPTLFRALVDDDGTLANPEELIEGVESMQLLYGVNLDQDVRATVDAYLTADNVTNWDEVISVRVSLLMQSVEDGSVPEAQPYNFNGVDYDGTVGNGSLPADNRVRRVFNTTISLRNRALGT